MSRTYKETLLSAIALRVLEPWLRILVVLSLDLRTILLDLGRWHRWRSFCEVQW